jgi:heat shock protein HslJ
MKKVTLLLFVFLALALVACGGGEETQTEEPTEVPAQEVEQEATDIPPTEAPPTEVPPTEVPPTETPETAEVPEPTSPLDTMEHVPDPNLVNITWEWERRDPNGNSIDEIIVPSPEVYTLFFNEDGTFNAQLDCNNANGLYKTPTPGNIFMELGLMTAAACESGSYADDMMNMFGPAQSYRFEDDGDVLVMVWVAGGPLDYYRNAEAVVEGEEEVKGIPPDAIQLDLQGLADFYSWQVMPASPIPQGPGGRGFPPHILLTFNGATPEQVMANNGPRLYIFPTQAYVNLYQAQGSNIVADQVTRLGQLITTADGRQELPEDPMPLLPPPNSFMGRWAQFLDLDFGVGRGVRYISDSPLRQDLGPWTNETTGYYYQGLTTDSTFYVSLFWPEATEALPNSVEDVPEDVLAASTNPETAPTYQQEIQETLSALPTSAWDPDLARLDAMAASLTFPTGAEGEGEETVEEEIELPAPEDGEATGTVLAPDGVFIRTGPGTEYPAIGAAPNGATGVIVGKSEDGQWWVMEVPVSEVPEGQGWVSAQFVEGTNAENVPVVPAPPQERFLTDTIWEWVSLADPQGLTSVNDPSRYTILFNVDGTANIQADCNSVGATYTTDESNISITLGPTTTAACEPDSLDQQFLAGLSNAAIYFFEADDLFMDLQADGGTMRFRGGTVAPSPAPTPTPDPGGETGATGIEFNLVSFGPVGAEQPILEGSSITATFTDTEVSGISGCNNYSAALTPVNDYFTVGPIATTQKTCNELAGVMEQEQAYLAALGGTSGYNWEEQLVNDPALVTAGQVFYVLPNGTSGVLNYVTVP